MQWYYSKGALQLGPIQESELISKIASGEVTGADSVWKEGMADWLPLSQVPALQTAVNPPRSAEVSSVPVPSPYTPPAYNASGSGQPIPTYLWQSIVVTLFCCMPFGIPAIVSSAKVDGLQARGDIPGALAASKTAKMWATIAFATGLITMVGYLILMFALGVQTQR